jgi:hypothetical protein
MAPERREAVVKEVIKLV